MFGKKLKRALEGMESRLELLADRVATNADALNRRISVVRDAQANELAQDARDIKQIKADIDGLKEDRKFLFDVAECMADAMKQFQDALDLLAKESGHEFYATEEIAPKLELTPGVPSHVAIRKIAEGKKD